MSSKSKTEKIQMFIQTLISVFTVSDIEKEFPNSKRIAQHIIAQLISSGELNVLQVQGKTNILIRTALLKEIEKFIQILTSAFTVIDIEKQFPSFSADQVYKILEKLTNQGKIKPVLQDKKLKWIKADLSFEQNLTHEEIKKPKTPTKVTRTETEEIVSSIKSLTGPFEIPDIENKLPGFSTDQIYTALVELTSQGKIKLVLQESQLKWVEDLPDETEMTRKKPKNPKTPVEVMKIKRLQIGLMNIRTAVETMEKEANQIQEEPKKTKGLAEVKETEVNWLQEKFKSIKSLLEMMKTSANQVQEEKELESAKKLLAVTEHETNQLKEELKSIKRSWEEIETSANQIQEQEREELNNVKKLLEVTEHETNQLQKELRKIKNFLETAEHEGKQLQKKIKNIRELMKMVEQEISPIQKEPQNIKKSVEEAEQKTSQVQEELQSTKGLMETAEQEINQIQKEHENAKNLVKVTKKEANQIQKTLRVLEACWRQ